MSLLIFLGTTQALANSIYPLDSAKKEAQFTHLLKDLRCLVCQNQDLAESNAELAQDLRAQVYQLVKEGKSDSEISDYLTSRYGDFILFKPPVKAVTLLLWFGPALFLLLGLLIFWRTCFGDSIMNEWWLLGLLIVLTLLASSLIVYPIRRHLIANLLLVPVIFVMAFAGYYYWGGFAKWQEYVHHQDSQAQAEAMLKSIKSPQELIDKLRAKLDDSPKSAKGWYLLGRLYTGQNEKQKAVDAFAKAYQLNSNEEQYAVNYAHSLWQLNNRQFTEQITQIFSNLLKNNPNQPDALAMLAMDSFVSHAYENAINYWQRLLKLAPQQSEEAQAIRKAIAKAQERLHQNLINL